jgi:scyllo-inositol 2-dehydrogenase (NADP+)
MDELGVGIVGYGLAGRVFHKMLVDATPGLRVAAIMSRDAEKTARARAENPDAAVVGDFDALVGHPNVDLVVLATPHDLHATQAVAALDAGKAVVTDKIMCRSVAEADTMIAAAARNHKLLSVFHNRRWDTDFLTVRAALDRGLLGEVWSVDICVARPGMPLSPLGPDKRWRATQAGFGGQLVDWGAHLMDQAVLLGGSEPDRVFCDLQFRHAGNETDSEGFVVLHYGSGLRITVTASVQTWIDRPHWFVNGSGGSLLIWDIDKQEWVMREGRVPAGTAEAAMPADKVQLRSAQPCGDFAPVPGDWVAYYRNVRDALRGEAELAVTAEQCRDALRVYERCFRDAGVVNETTAGRAAGLLG